MMFNSRRKPDFIMKWTVFLCLIASGLFAGTTGKLAGKVFDENKDALAGVNVVIQGTLLGASTDVDGFYYVINIPPGSYDVEFSYVGYKTKVVKDVNISADQTTTLEESLESSTFEGETVTVTAKRPVVELNATSAVATVGSDEIHAMPVLNLSDIVDLQAGVVDGHFRGGRLGEVQYQLNGVSVNNNYDNSMSLQLDRSLLQEVQVISGTFDAEYGQAMSGVVNVILKSGSENFKWNAETFFSDYMYTSGKRRGQEDKFRPTAIQNYQVGISGPLPLPQTYFLASYRRYLDDGYIYGFRRFIPTDTSNFETKTYYPTGDNAEIPLETSDETTGLIKFTNQSLGNIKLEYQAIFNWILDKNYNWAFRLNPDGASKQRTFSIVHGLDITHTLSPSTFYTVNLRQNYFDYSDYVYKDFNDSRYDAAGPPISADINYEYGAVVQGVSLARFKQINNTFIAKAALTSQVTRSHLIKIGLEGQYSALKFGTPGYIVASGYNIVRHQNEPPNYPSVQTYHPINFIAYGQDQIEWQDFVFRAGVRWEYFDARAKIPGDLRNPANLQGFPQADPVRVSAKTSLAPRIGVSYPVSETAALFFAYGHFYQMPSLGKFFSNSDYNKLENIQAGGNSYDVLGNPNLKPERTVQYEFGYKDAITPTTGINIDIFFKDIRNLLGVEILSTYNSAEYSRLTNVDFGNVLGYTISFDQRRLGPLSVSMDYTWQTVMGNSSDPNETATRAEAGEDARPRLIPLNWDQRHTLNLSLIYELQNDLILSSIARYASGQPYTPSIRSGFGGELEENSGRKNTSIRVDVRAEKSFKLSAMDFSVYLRVLNVFDTDFVNGFVFGDTGSPDYTITAGQESQLANPNRYYEPRRVELGISLSAN